MSTLTVYPNPNPETTTVDGEIQVTTGGSTFDAIRESTTGSGISDSANTFRAGELWSHASVPDRFGFLMRGFVLFDLSAVAGNVISQAVVSFVSWQKLAGIGEPALHLAAATPASNTALVVGDFDNIGRVSFGSISYATWNADLTTYNDITLNAAGLASLIPGGIAKFSTQLDWDLEGLFGGTEAMGAGSGFGVYAADQAGTTKDPKLVLTYAPELAALSLRIDAKLDGVSWTDITSDTIAEEGLSIAYGIQGSGPMDNLASTGICTFTLKNWDTAGDVGAYSPSHGSVRSGWALGLPIQVVFVADADTPEEFVKFSGKVQYIDPDPGLYGPKRVHVIAHDYIGDLAEVVIRTIPAQVNKTDRQLIDAIRAELPASTLPPAANIDTGIDTYPYADFGDGTSAMALLKDVLDSVFGKFFQLGDGTHVYRNRETLTFTDSVATFDETDLSELRVPSDLRDTYNRVIVDIPQFEIGASTQVLAAAEGQDPVGIAPGETIDVWLPYRDPDDVTSLPVLIAGTSYVDPPLSGTDYVFNAAADGSGANMTANVTTVAFFGTSLKYTLTNTHATNTAFRITLQGRGLAIRRLTPLSYESSSVQPYGERTLYVSTRFQDNPSVAQFMATYLRGQYEVFTQRPTLVALKSPVVDPAMLREALTREPGDRITLSETVTGVSADAIIQSVELEVRQLCSLTCRWGLAPQSAFMFINPWLLGTAGRSELGETTILG